jgi:hypothetical protein
MRLAVEAGTLDSNGPKRRSAGSIRQTETKIDELRNFLLTGAGRLSDLKNLQARCLEGLDRISARAARLENEIQLKAREKTELAYQIERGREDFARKPRAERGDGGKLGIGMCARPNASRVEQVSDEVSAHSMKHVMQHRIPRWRNREAAQQLFGRRPEIFIDANPRRRFCSGKNACRSY